MSHRYPSLSSRTPDSSPVLLLLITTLLAGSLLAGCDAGGDDTDAGGTAYLEGRVVSSAGNPITGALVTASPGGETTLSDSTGLYELPVEVDSTMDVTITIEKEGFQRRSQTTLARAGQTSTHNITLVPTGGQDPDVEPGRPSNIQLQALSREQIGVKESGAPEVSRVTFQVTDSTGRPIDLDESTQVQFRLGQAPDGAFIAPQSAPTNDNGEVTVNVSSGTAAGVVQLLASADVEGDETIRSKPVAVSIHGGLPDQDHFTVGPAQFNYPGLVTAGLQNAISVIVGDQYGNPVVPGTSVYFTTTGGIIEGSLKTDDQGRGSVNLISGNPEPEDGIVVVTATTADTNTEPVRDQVPVIFSGPPVLEVSPSSVAVGQSYEVTLTDRNGNPLAEGTTLSVAAGGTNVQAVGNTSLTLGDTNFQGGLTYEDVERGSGITRFNFRIVQADPQGDPPSAETVTITVGGPNGQREVVLGAGAGAQAQTEDGVVQTLPGGGVKVYSERR